MVQLDALRLFKAPAAVLDLSEDKRRACGRIAVWEEQFEVAAERVRPGHDTDLSARDAVQLAQAVKLHAAAFGSHRVQPRKGPVTDEDAHLVLVGAAEDALDSALLERPAELCDFVGGSFNRVRDWSGGWCSFWWGCVGFVS